MMGTVMAASPGDRADELRPAARAPFLVSVPDAERLLLQSRFVKSLLEAELLLDLEARIRGAQLLEPSLVPPDLVTMNSQVLLREVDDGREIAVTLVFPSCANVRKDEVSVLSPLGSLLLGARIGQQITCPIAGSISTVSVEAILHQPEAAGDYYG